MKRSCFTYSGTEGNVVNTNSFAVSSALSDGTYYWRATTQNCAGVNSQWSKSYTFEVDTLPPNSPILKAPDNNALIESDKVKLSWYNTADQYVSRVVTNKMSHKSQDYSSKQIIYSKNLVNWFEEQAISIVLSTGDTNKVLVLSINSATLSMKSVRLQDNHTGVLAITKDALLIQDANQLWEYRIVRGKKSQINHDALFMPTRRFAMPTASLQDLYAVGESGNFICIDKTLNQIIKITNHEVKVLWKPHYQSAIEMRDYSISGIALIDDVPRYMTSVPRSTLASSSGKLIYLPLNAKEEPTNVNGLSIPQSPRWYSGKLWLLNSGKGEFGIVDLTNSNFEPILFGPGFMQVLQFHNQYAIISLSASMPDGISFPSVLQHRLNGKEPQCGLMIVNLISGKLEHWLRFVDDIREIIDIAVMPYARPKIIVPPTPLSDFESTPYITLVSSKKTSPRVSVIMPVYNGAGYIDEAIKSALNQTYESYEIIIVDDGSTDETRDIVESYDDEIRYFYQKNQGVSAARNHGINEARGDILAFLDADDIYYPDKLTEQMQIFDMLPHVSMVHSGWHLIDKYSRIFGSRELWEWYPELDIRAWLRGIVFPASIMIQKAWVTRVGGFRTEFDTIEDVDIVIRIALAGGKSAWLPTISAGYRHHETNATRHTPRQASLFDQLYNDIFARSDLSPNVKQLESETRYANKLLSAYRLYQTGYYDLMALYLRQTIQYSPHQSSDLPAKWHQSFQQASVDLPNTFDESHFTDLPQWKALVDDLKNS